MSLDELSLRGRAYNRYPQHLRQSSRTLLRYQVLPLPDNAYSKNFKQRRYNGLRPDTGSCGKDFMVETKYITFTTVTRLLRLLARVASTASLHALI